MMKACAKCGKVMGWLFLLVGVGLLLQDLGQWAFWNISGWTAIFLILGVCGLAKSTCKDCCKMK